MKRNLHGIMCALYRSGELVMVLSTNLLGSCAKVWKTPFSILQFAIVEKRYNSTLNVTAVDSDIAPDVPFTITV
jgi:hypothetical protein